MKEEKIFRRKYTFDTLTDTVTIDFGCGCLSSQSKKTVIEAYELIVFNLYAIYYSRAQKIWCRLVL